MDYLIERAPCGGLEIRPDRIGHRNERHLHEIIRHAEEFRRLRLTAQVQGGEHRTQARASAAPTENSTPQVSRSPKGPPT